MMKIKSLFVVGALLFSIARTFAGDSTFTLKATTFVFDPGRTNICSAKWVNNEGLADTDQDLAAGNPGKGLVLKKLGTTATNASAGATIFGVTWIAFKELGFDVRDDGHCGAGAPRFNVTTADGVLHFCGCSGAAEHTPFTDAQGRAWTRVRFSGPECSPPINPTDIILSIDLVFDEGTDQGTGITTLDNITVNGTLIRN